MGDISEFFTRDEFACRCGCGFKAVDKELLGILERIREHFGKPVHITNACRCLTHNRQVGSQDNSQHIKGMAADIWIRDVPPENIVKFLDEFCLLKQKGGIGIYKTFVHIDVRDQIARWRKDDD